MQFFLKWVGIFFFSVLFILIVFRLGLLNKTRVKIKTEQVIPSRYNVIIVFGAGVNPNDLPTKVLQDRLDKTIHLLNLNNFEKVLLSGGKTTHHNEAKAMNTYLTNRGISPKLLVMDDAGISTFDSLKRAKDIYQISSAILVTQRFHLPRAIAIEIVKLHAGDLCQLEVANREAWDFNKSVGACQFGIGRIDFALLHDDIALIRGGKKVVRRQHLADAIKIGK